VGHLRAIALVVSKAAVVTKFFVYSDAVALARILVYRDSSSIDVTGSGILTI